MSAGSEASGSSISFVAGAVAWAVLVVAGAPLAAAMMLVNRDLYMFVFLVAFCGFCLGYGGMISAWSERRTKRGRQGLALAATAVAASVLLVVVPGRFRFSPFLFVLLGLSIGPVLAPLLALRVRRSSVRVWPLVVLWLAPAVTLPVWAIIDFWMGRTAGARLVQAFTMPPLVLTGPWATQAGRLVDFPNAGEFFSLPLALALTVAVIAVIGLYVKRERWRASIIIPYATLTALWAVIGFGQLLNCMS